MQHHKDQAPASLEEASSPYAIHSQVPVSNLFQHIILETSNLPLAGFETQSVCFRHVYCSSLKQNQTSSHTKLPLAAQEYMAHTRLTLANAQTKINVANHKAVIQRFQEYRLLLKIGEEGRKLSMLDPQTALTLARLARETLTSEYELALAKLDACRQELITLQDAVDEALVYMADADEQVAQIFNILNRGRINVPGYPIPFPPNPTYDRPDSLFMTNSINSGSSSSDGGMSYSNNEELHQ